MTHQSQAQHRKQASPPHGPAKHPNESHGESPCPVCGGAPLFLYTIDRFEQPFDILRCPDCKLQMQAAIPADASDLYDEGYYTGRSEYSYRDERRQRRFDRYVLDARLRTIAKYRPAPADFVDVGAAFGGFVEAAADAGYRARGLDVSEYAAADARSRDLDVRAGELEPGVFETQSVDVLTMIEVFEHLTEPRRAMQALRECMRPGGLVIVQTANYRGAQARNAGSDYHYYLPGHFYYYSSDNLRRLFAEFGFSRVKIFRPVDFGLLAKLKKSRGGFTRPRDYLRWLRIAWYHWKGMLHFGEYALTSSMVMYAWRDE
ncbi:MAG: class I SAM-dependent methyltransferase [bacterium]|nr:class I SAM-dependent methyltransferase [bacterium]